MRHALELQGSLVDPKLVRQQHHPLRDVFGEIADALEVVGDAQRPDDLPQIDRHRLPPCDGDHGLFLDLPLQLVDLVIHRHDFLGEHDVTLR